MERPAHDRVKTDRRDAERLVRLLMMNGLPPVRVPSGRGRGVPRPRPCARGGPRRSEASASPGGRLLLRHDVRYEDGASAWTAAHRAWLSKVELGRRAAQSTLLDYLGAIDALVIRREASKR